MMPFALKPIFSITDTTFLSIFIFLALSNSILLLHFFWVPVFQCVSYK